MPGSPGGDAGKDEASDAGVASEAAYLQGRRVDVGASGKADGAGPGAASANMRSAPAAQRGNNMNSGAYTIRLPAAWMR